jgi:glycerophosphoryl diester phosphodiesterase
VATSLSAREARIFILASRAYGLAANALQVPERIGDTVLADAGLVAAARRRSLKLYVWTINDEARMRELAALGVDGLITDRPDRLAALR